MPNLRKTDFVAIATALADLRACIDAIDSDPPAYRQRRQAQAFDSAARTIAVRLARHSGTFDGKRFLSACGVK